MLWDAMMDALVAGCAEVPAPVDATFGWYFRDEDRWLTVESRGGRLSVTPGLADAAEMKFYSSCVADFIHQHATEGAGRAIFQGGGFYWRGDINRLKEISPICKNLFGPRLHQRLVSAGIAVPRFEVRRYPARTKAQRDRILAEWQVHGERAHHAQGAQSVAPVPVVDMPVPEAPPTPVMEIPHAEPVIPTVSTTSRAARPVKPVKAATSSRTARAPQKAPTATKTAPKSAAKPAKSAAPSAKAAPRTSGKKVSSKAAKVARKA